MRMRRFHRAFTLLELMVSLAVMAMLLLLISQATTAISRTYKSGIARVDNFTQARSVLNLLTRDLQAIVLRPDLAAFVDAAGDPSFVFYSRVEGTSGQRDLSLVSYAFYPASNSYKRNDLGFEYLSTTSPTLSLNQTTKIPGTASFDPDQAQPIADGLLALKWQSLNAAGELKETFQYDYSQPELVSNSQSIVVSILILDNDARSLAEKQGKLDALRALFAGTPTDMTYSEHWNAIRSAPDFAATFPEPVRRGIRGFSRSVPLPVASVPTKPAVPVP